GHAAARGSGRRRGRGASVHGAVGRPRSPDPHLRRATALQLPAVAAGLRGAVPHRCAVARLHPSASLRGDSRLSAARAALRQSRRLMSRNLLLRIVFAAVAIPVALWGIYRGGWLLALLLALLGMRGTWEVYALARRRGIEPLTELGLLGAAALPVLGYLGLPATALGVHCFYCGTDATLLLTLGAMWVLSVFGAALRVRAPTERPLAAIAVTVLGPLYASGLLSFLYLLRYGPVATVNPGVGLAYAALPLVVMWVCDTAAMAVGTALGGPKLAPVVSPNKTWSGAIAGL